LKTKDHSKMGASPEMLLSELQNLVGEELKVRIFAF
jgi:hypothetical protein